MIYPLIGDLGTPELLIIFVVVILVFGGKKLPDLARGSGRALRIFKAEVNATDDPDDDEARPAGEAKPVATRTDLEARTPAPTTDLEARQAAEQAALEARHAAEREEHPERG